MLIKYLETKINLVKEVEDVFLWGILMAKKVGDCLILTLRIFLSRVILFSMKNEFPFSALSPNNSESVLHVPHSPLCGDDDFVEPRNEVAPVLPPNEEERGSIQEIVTAPIETLVPKVETPAVVEPLPVPHEVVAPLPAPRKS